jgi:hypothetical protein
MLACIASGSEAALTTNPTPGRFDRHLATKN